MKRLFITRHGQAVSRAPIDEARPLTERGQTEVRRIWELLAGEGIAPVRLVSSPYIRARQTAAEISSVYGGLAVIETPLLVPEADPEQMLEWLLREQDPGELVLVTHMPLAGLLAGLLCDGRRGSHVPFETGAVAALELEVAAAGAGRLLWLRTPAEVFY